MPSTLHLNTGYIAVSIIAVGFMILYPVVLALIAHQKLHVSWRYFGYGALIFFLIIELVIAAFGIIAIWVIWALRDKPVAVTTPSFEPEPIS